MSGQEQIKVNKKKPAGCGGDDNTGNQDLTGELPDIAQLIKENNQLIKKAKRTISKSKNKNRGVGGYCEWSDICSFDCPEKRPKKEKRDGI